MDRTKKEYAPDPNTQIEFRTPMALEAIAYYLDRIESHLAALVAVQHSPSAPVVQVLQGIHKALNERR